MGEVTDLVVIDSETASAVEIRTWSLAVRDQIPTMGVDELAQLEALLAAVKIRLRQLGSDIDEAERTRIRAVQRIGQLLDQDDLPSQSSDERSTLDGQDRNRRHHARLLAAYPDVVDEAVAAPDCSLSAVVKACQTRRQAEAPESEWTVDELTLRKIMLANHGGIVVANMSTMPHLIAWATTEGRYERIDRRTDWGNPFVLPGDGSRDEVVRNYRDVYLPHKPSLRQRLGELRGQALGCWCAPETCHGDVLREAAMS